MKKFFIPMIAALLVLSSCGVSKKLYEGCQADNKSLTDNYNSAREQIASLTAQLNAAKDNNTSLTAALAASKASAAALQATLDKSLENAGSNNVNIAKLVDQINESNKYIRHLQDCKNKSDSLNLVLTTNLTKSLSASESKDVDVQVMKGVVYISLNDNMLYKSGSYEISDKAKETLRSIAKVIKDYPTYSVLIEGNTDNVKYVTPKGGQIRNNWDLSCMRASSVAQYLINNFGVAPKRLTAGGRGEFNPVATNDTPAGKAKNRRTQIIITPQLDEFMDLIGQAPAEK